MIGDKHPAALGEPARRVFPEAWDLIGPMLMTARSGTPTWVEDEYVPLRRRGFLEECYFTFSYSPVQNALGDIEGVLDIAAETTARVVSRRRLELLTSVSERLADADDLEDLVRLALPILRGCTRDLPAVDILLPGASVAEGIRPPQMPSDGRAASRQDLQTLRDGRVAWLPLTPGGGEPSPYLVVTRGPSVAVRYQPAVELTRIGGDWYDWFSLPDDSLVLVIGDVAGHDERAAAAMAQVRNVLHGVAYTALSGTPGTVLRGVDRALLGSTRGILATALLARVTRTAAEAGLDVEWSNAGHPPPVLVSPDGRARLLETEPDLLLGLDENVERQDHHLHVQAGATLVLYTDGLIERRDAPISQGLSWLAEVLADTHEMDPEKLCDFLLDAADASEDDVALLVLRA